MNKFFIAAVVCGAMTVISFIYARKDANKQLRTMQSIPIISTEAELRDALAGEPQGYLVENAVLTGEPVKDPYDFFQPDTMLYICGEKESYQKLKPDKKREFSGDWMDVENPTATVSSPKFYLYGDIPFPMEQFDISECMNLSKVCQESKKSMTEIDFYYYPEGNQLEWNNTRYSFYCLKNNEPITFAAKIGNNQFIAEAVNSFDTSINQFCTAEEYVKKYISGENSGSLVFPIMFFVWGIIFLIYGIKKENGTKKK